MKERTGLLYVLTFCRPKFPVEGLATPDSRKETDVWRSTGQEGLNEVGGGGE